MTLDYLEIGKRISRRRHQLKMTQTAVEEKAGIGYKYLSNVERGISIPSTEVVMRLAMALDTTPDEFLVGTAIHNDEPWRTVADQLRPLSRKQLRLVSSFIDWMQNEEL